MESMTLTPVSKRVKWIEGEKKLNVEAYELINHINIMLELIIVNTLQFNKLTQADEILEKLLAVYYETETQADLNINIETIDNICNALCENNGVLVKLVKKNINYYKLNHKNYM
jgi:hypothetical protein